MAAPPGATPGASPAVAQLTLYCHTPERGRSSPGRLCVLPWSHGLAWGGGSGVEPQPPPHPRLQTCTSMLWPQAGAATGAAGRPWRRAPECRPRESRAGPTPCPPPACTARKEATRAGRARSEQICKTKCQRRERRSVNVPGGANPNASWSVISPRAVPLKRAAVSRSLVSAAEMTVSGEGDSGPERHFVPW